MTVATSLTYVIVMYMANAFAYWTCRWKDIITTVVMIVYDVIATGNTCAIGYLTLTTAMLTLVLVLVPVRLALSLLDTSYVNNVRVFRSVVYTITVTGSTS